MFVCCECCMLSGRSLCDELFTRPEESQRLWCVVVCDLETPRMTPWPALGCSVIEKRKYALNDPEQSRSHFLPGGSLKSSIVLLPLFVADKRSVHVKFYQEFDLSHLYIINFVFR